MNILILGANGFIGRHLSRRLSAAGHNIWRGVRSRDGSSETTIAVDFMIDVVPEVWLARLRQIDVVINAVGIIEESGRRRFQRLHTDAPCALFRACLAARIEKVIQISALGADAGADSRYHLSKKAADDFLSTLDLKWVIVQPSLVYGDDGTSSAFLRRLASWPLTPVPGSGNQRLQPIHIEDLCACVVNLVQSDRCNHQRIPLVGPEPIAYRDYLLSLGRQMAIPTVRIVGIPMPLIRLAARVGQWLPNSPLSPQTLAMLERGNTGSPDPVRRLLGRNALAVDQFIPADKGACLRTEARLGWLLPLLKLSLSLLWILSGIVSLGIYPVEASLGLLKQIGILGTPAWFTLYGFAVADICLGLLIWFRPGRRLWLLLAGIVIGYSSVIAVFLPAFLIHPFMPVGKNLPILGLLLVLLVLETERDR